jgi:hypothetical protein
MSQATVEATDVDATALSQHLIIQQASDDIKQMHARRQTLQEVAFYTAHDPRRETAEYKAAHHHLVVELDLPCLICGVTNSILGDPAKQQDVVLNSWGAKQNETHHHAIEWALANAVDPDKFNQRMLPILRARHPDETSYQVQDFSAEQIAAWVDHSPDNLWVLCDIHHRHTLVGIHAITLPIWGPLDLLKVDVLAQYQQLLRTGSGKAA